MTSKVTIQPHNSYGKGIDVVVQNGEVAEELHVDDNATLEVTIWHGKEITSIKEVE